MTWACSSVMKNRNLCVNVVMIFVMIVQRFHSCSYSESPVKKKRHQKEVKIEAIEELSSAYINHNVLHYICGNYNVEIQDTRS